jgi:hypothetical protein
MEISIHMSISFPFISHISMSSFSCIPSRSKGHWPTALELQGLLRQQGLRCDTVTFNCCIDAAKRWEDALRLLRGMELMELAPVTWYRRGWTYPLVKPMEGMICHMRWPYPAW